MVSSRQPRHPGFRIGSGQLIFSFAELVVVVLDSVHIFLVAVFFSSSDSEAFDLIVDSGILKNVNKILLIPILPASEMLRVCVGLAELRNARGMMDRIE